MILLQTFWGKNIKILIKKSILITKFVLKKIYHFFRLYDITENKLHYPVSLQFPITNKCNLDCLMCNIKCKNTSKEISLEILNQTMHSKLFKKITSVGVNGGEPFVMKDIVERISVLATSLPKLKSIYIISNGTLTDIMLKKLPLIYEICKRNKIYFQLSISIDGIGKIHDKVRCKDGTFDKALNTINIINANLNKYCDYLNVICTVSKANVYNLPETDEFAKIKGWSISYNIATVHERLFNYNKINSFSIFDDQISKNLAIEFFYKKFLETKSEIYFSIYLYLLSDGKHRPCNCFYLRKGITLSPEGNVCYCATHSKELGNVCKDDIKQLYFSNKKYNDYIRNNYCSECSHYMMGNMYFKDYLKYINEVIGSYNYKL